VIRFFNTLTGQKEIFTPLKPPQVTIYVCGVTVYDDCHIGHARGAFVFDVLRRFLTLSGFKVIHVRNITDIDDKIIERARSWGDPALDLKDRVRSVAEHFTKRFRSDFARLGLLVPDHEPMATEYIHAMQVFIQRLLDRGMAYVTKDGVYFSVKRFSDYGRLSHQRIDRMLEGVRIELAEGKEDPLDFALWKRAKPEEPAWDSPWGAGRPGWHIECSTMSTALLGDAFDIHGGGQDLVFPHHENERAQSVAAGKPFARFWMHNGLLTVEGKKMAKSLGNFITIPQALERHSADVLRLFFLSAHYRSPLDFTWGRLEEAAHAYERLVDCLAHAQQQMGVDLSGDEARLVDDRAEEKFRQALQDDLNTPQALSVLFEQVAQVAMWRKEVASLENALRIERAVRTIRRLGEALGLTFAQIIPENIQALIRQREEARRRKDFVLADAIRSKIASEGFVVEDTPLGPVVRRKF